LHGDASLPLMTVTLGPPGAGAEMTSQASPFNVAPARDAAGEVHVIGEEAHDRRPSLPLMTFTSGRRRIGPMRMSEKPSPFTSPAPSRRRR